MCYCNENIRTICCGSLECLRLRDQICNSVNTPEPSPKENNLPAVWDLVIQDMKERDSIGKSKYGTRLQPFNGRDPLVDAFQEALDLVVYLRQAIYERDQNESAKVPIT